MANRTDGAADAARQAFWTERRVTVRAAGSTRHFTLSPRAQMLGAAVAAATVLWTGAATVTATLGGLERGALEARLDRLEAANAAALAEFASDKAAVIAELSAERDAAVAALTAQRDALASEADAARDRLAALSEALTDRQTRLMDAAEIEAELSLALESVRAGLRDATSARDAAMLRQQTLTQELRDALARAEAAEAAETEWTEATAAIIDALQEAAELRDAAETRRGALETQLAAIETRAERAEAARARLYDQLEDAIAAGLGGLERTLTATGFVVDVLVERLRRDYSGQGGPFVPAKDGVPAAAEAAGADAARVTSLMSGLERASLLRLATDKMPLAHPVRGASRFTSGFGMRRDPLNGRMRMHAGADFAGRRGTPIHATADGVVVFAGWQSGYGRVVKVRHAFGFETVYAHLNKARVKVGDRVALDDRIGDMGRTGRSTGVHLHYEIRVNGRPVNPMKYIEAARNVL